MDLSRYQPNSQFLLYKTDKGEVKIDVLLQNETIWLSQKQIETLFGVQRPAVTKHLNNIFATGELDEKV
ncbi:cell filamentation protein Fic, partial [Streptococcus pneumoniae]|nr:cell filamentation protein Fic [Streptococcus pneumoniae]